MFYCISFSQNKSAQKEKIICCEQVAPFVDSIRNKILTDTSLFYEKDVVYTIIGYKNTRNYSPLFLINETYSYKLDVINAKQVKEFVAAFLNADKIEEVIIFNGSRGATIWGSRGTNGVILIKLKKDKTTNYKIASLKMLTKKTGDNFSTRKSDSPLIHD